MMLKYKETEYTGRLGSEEKVQSRTSYPANQDILYPGRLHPKIDVWVKERNNQKIEVDAEIKIDAVKDLYKSTKLN